ncbi:MAG TPA: polyphosphate kinase 2 [Rhizomicrobium sp.]|jgi:polyphosphate kinase 2|nr:polyphosphate kinase 2 [Rhizomicrobium sp.]
MSKHKLSDDSIGDKQYEEDLRELQIELVKLQRHLIATNARVLVIIEGRDAAGKDGTIKRLTEHMSPRETMVYAPSKPTERENSEWYFQRFIPHLPAGGEFTIFNRSWYNRAGVERVMGFCSHDQVREFFRAVVPFEETLVHDGLALRKYYLDIDRKEQKERLEERRDDPLKRWKISPIDEAAQKKWSDYSKARDAMFRHTSHPAAPWHVVRADVKKIARLNILRDLLDSFRYPGKSGKRVRPDREIVFPWAADLPSGLIAK